MSDAMLKLADAYTRTGRNGNVYQVAYLANLKLLIFPVHDPATGPSEPLAVPGAATTAPGSAGDCDPAWSA